MLFANYSTYTENARDPTFHPLIGHYFIHYFAQEDVTQCPPSCARRKLILD